MSSKNTSDPKPTSKGGIKTRAGKKASGSNKKVVKKIAKRIKMHTKRSRSSGERKSSEGKTVVTTVADMIRELRVDSVEPGGMTRTTMKVHFKTNIGELVCNPNQHIVIEDCGGVLTIDEAIVEKGGKLTMPTPMPADWKINKMVVRGSAKFVF